MPSNSTKPFQEWYDGYLKKLEKSKATATVTGEDKPQTMADSMQVVKDFPLNVTEWPCRGEGQVRDVEWAAGSPGQMGGSRAEASPAQTYIGSPNGSTPQPATPSSSFRCNGLSENPGNVPSPLKYQPSGFDLGNPQKGEEASQIPSRLQYLKGLQLPRGCYNLVNLSRTTVPVQPKKPVGLAYFQSLSSRQPNNRKRPHWQISGSLNNASSPNAQATNTSDDDRANSISIKRQRFLKTAEALQKSGLMKVTMQSASLLKQNLTLQREIEELKRDTEKFFQWVLSNPENQHLRGVPNLSFANIVPTGVSFETGKC